MATKKSAKVISKGVDSERLAFVRSVHLAGLGLDKLSASVDRVHLASARARGEDLSVSVAILQRVVDLQDDSFVVGASVTLLSGEGEDGDSAVRIEASFSAKFDTSKKADPAAAANFANLEARLVFFPYIRQFVSDLTYRMSIDPIVLPLSSQLEG